VNRFVSAGDGLFQVKAQCQRKSVLMPCDLTSQLLDEPDPRYAWRGAGGQLG
jgi:hypothetical protein